MTVSPNPAILLITSHVVRGRVGARAQAFALERLGVEPWIAPTILLPFHPGHGTGTRIVPSTEQFAAMLEDLRAKSLIDQLGAVATGYFPNSKLVEAVAAFIHALKQDNPDLHVTCDPVIGESEGLYVDPTVAEAIRDQLIPRADLVTPNRYELAWLSKTSPNDNHELIAATKTFGDRMWLVTTAFPMMRRQAATLLSSGDTAILAEASHFEDVPHGPGDLAAALFTAHRLRGASPERALERTVGAVHEVLAASNRAQSDELSILDAQPFLDKPRAPVAMRRLVGREVTASKAVRGRLSPRPLTGQK